MLPYRKRNKGRILISRHCPAFKFMSLPDLIGQSNWVEVDPPIKSGDDRCFEEIRGEYEDLSEKAEKTQKK